MFDTTVNELLYEPGSPLSDQRQLNEMYKRLQHQKLTHKPSPSIDRHEDTSSQRTAFLEGLGEKKSQSARVLPYAAPE
eukprot:UN00900